MEWDTAAAGTRGIHSHSNSLQHMQDATTSTRQDTVFTTAARGNPPPWQVNSPWEGREQGTKETALQEHNKPWSEQADLTIEMNFCLQNTLSLQLESLTIKPECHPRTGPCGVSLRSDLVTSLLESPHLSCKLVRRCCKRQAAP